MEIKNKKNYYLIKKANLKNVKGYYYPNNFKTFLTSKTYKEFLNLNLREQKIQAKILDLEMRKNLIVRIKNKTQEVKEFKKILEVKKVEIKEVKKVVEEVKKSVKNKKNNDIIKIDIKGFRNITTKKLIDRYININFGDPDPKIELYINHFNKFGYKIGKTIYRINGQFYKRNSLNVDSFKELEYEKDGLLIQKKAKVENKKLLISELTKITMLGFSKWIPKMNLSEQQAEEFANTTLKNMMDMGITDIEELKGKFYSYAGFISKNGKINKKLLATLTEIRIIDPHGTASRKLDWSNVSLLDTYEFEQEQNGTSDIIIDNTININDRKTIKKDTAIIKFIELRKKGMNSRNHKDFNVSYREYMTLRDSYKEFKEFEKEWN